MLPVLMYHGLHTDRHDDGRFHPVYSVHPSEFARHLDRLVHEGYRSVRLAEVDEASANRRVLITFDDGDISNVTTALPMLLERGLTAEFFITSDYVGQTGMMQASDLPKLVEAGMGVQSHGRTHRPLSDLALKELREELVSSKSALEAWTGAPVDGLSLPGGRGGRREQVEIVTAGYRHLLNSVPGPNRAPRAGQYLQRIPVTRQLTVDAFADLVRWRGLKPRRARLRVGTLEGAKRLLGNDRYTAVRNGLLAVRHRTTG